MRIRLPKEALAHPKALIISYGAMFVEGALMLLLVALMPYYAERLGRNLGDIAWLISIKSLGTFSMLFFSGKLADRYGKRLPISIGAVFFILFLAGYLFVQDYYLALVFAFLGGLGQGFMDAPSMALLFDIFPNNAGPAMSLVQGFFAGGAVLMTFSTSLFIEQPFFVPALLLFFLAFCVALLLLTLTSPLPSRAYQEVSESKVSTGSLEDELAQDLSAKVQASWKKEGFWLIVATLLGASFTSVWTTWLSTYLQVAKDFTLSLSVSSLSIYQIGAVSGGLVFAVILKKRKGVQVFLENTCVVLLCLSLLSVLQHSVALRLIVFATGFFAGLFFSVCIQLGGEFFFKTPGTATGIVASTYMMGNAFMNAVTGTWVDSVGVVPVFMFLFVFLLLLIVATFYLRRAYFNFELQQKNS